MTPNSPQVKFSCKACSAVLSVPSAAAGTVTQGPCPYCGATLRFTHPAPKPVSVPTPVPVRPQPIQTATAPQLQQPQQPAPAAAPQFQQPAAARPEPRAQLLPVERYSDPEPQPARNEEPPSNPVASQLAGTLPTTTTAAPHQNPKDARRTPTRRLLDLVAVLTILGLLGAIGWVGWEKFEPEIRDFVAQTGLILPSAETSSTDVAGDAPES
ncbi:MAG: hypothetical protein ACI8UO_003035 [Verrucomicrobiales bacterium]|jgi:hypothetical protein